MEVDFLREAKLISPLLKINVIFARIMAYQNPDDRAKELHNMISDERKRKHTTTAVGNTTEQISIVGTNEEYMRMEIRRALLSHEIIAKSQPGNHAEENVILEAEARDLNLIEIGASRPICLDCENLLLEKNIEAFTDFSGKPSKNRR